MLLTLASSAHACGPDFPNNLLDGGDEAVLVAPLADFGMELQRLHLRPGRFDYVSATNGYEQQTFDAELADLATALKKAKTPGAEAARIIEGHRVNRAKLRQYLEELDVWNRHHPAGAMTEDRGDGSVPTGPVPRFPGFDEVPGLPAEFADYFAGAAASRKAGGDPTAARESWERLLARPAAERKFKSTWAAFMLGKSWEGEDDDQAVDYFQQTRDLARHGFADSTGLAAAALGFEARVELRREHFQRAMKLYLEQYVAGDHSAVISLQWAAGAALAAGGQELGALAASADTRAVITTYLSCSPRASRPASADSPEGNSAVSWLETVEAQHVKDVESAERLALVAYQNGEFEIAQRWIQRARNTPVAQWLQAKLFLRAGKISQAAALLARVTDLLPVLADSATNATAEFADSLWVASGSHAWNSARHQVLGELGVLRLSRREFTQSLDALLNAGFWPDAAYVAERVLTTDELKTYVARHWPPPVTPAIETVRSETGSEPPPTDTRGEDIRHLLARRLTRELRSGEAREYYPAAWQPKFDELVAALDAGWNESAPREQRAQALFASAIMARTNGMELLGTELAPDWFIHGGNFEFGLTWEQRSNITQSSTVNLASEAELNRAARHRADPEARFHYRYQAAFLAWEAAKLMPDNADETARVLCTAGTWLKLWDPDTADLFYKALVRRCRKTAIGEQADRMRWFPVLDAAGNPKPYRSRLQSIRPAEPPAESTESDAGVGGSAPTAEEFPVPGQSYVVHSGDSLSGIAQAASAWGKLVTVKQIEDANPGLEANRLQVGQRLLIPE